MSTASVFSDVICELGEGPSLDSDRGVVVWFDILGRRMLERRPDRSGTRVTELGFMGTAAARTGDGRLVIVGDNGLMLHDPAAGTMASLLPVEADQPERRANDARVHPCGALWFSTMQRAPQPGTAVIHHVLAGRLTTIVTGLGIPNAICFTPDGSAAFYACSMARTLWRVSCDPATGLPTGAARVFAQLSEDEGEPDGAVIDGDGLLWNARWGTGCVAAHAPDGSVVRRLAVPATRSSCPAFLGPGQGLVVTSAREGMEPAELAADPLAGQTFLLPGPFSGRPEPAIRLS